MGEMDVNDGAVLTARLPRVHPLLSDRWEKHTPDTHVYLDLSLIGIIVLGKTEFCCCLSVSESFKGTINIFISPSQLSLPLSSDVLSLVLKRSCILSPVEDAIHQRSSPKASAVRQFMQMRQRWKIFWDGAPLEMLQTGLSVAL